MMKSKTGSTDHNNGNHDLWPTDWLPRSLTDWLFSLSTESNSLSFEEKRTQLCLRELQFLNPSLNPTIQVPIILFGFWSKRDRFVSDLVWSLFCFVRFSLIGFDFAVSLLTFVVFGEWEMQRAPVTVEEQLLQKAIKEECTWENLPKRIQATLSSKEEWHRRLEKVASRLILDPIVLLFSILSLYFKPV